MGLRIRFLILMSRIARYIVSGASLIALTRFIFIVLPRSRLHLDHYLNGKGRPLKINTGQLLKADMAVGQLLASSVVRGGGEGLVHIPQWQMASLDWRLAVGSFDLNWHCVGSGILVRLQGCYAWQPCEDRPTRAFHEAAFGLARRGARPFALAGTFFLCSNNRVDKWRRMDRFMPTDKLYM